MIDSGGAILIGRESVQEMLAETPDLVDRFLRSELWRFTKRVRAKTVRERLKGSPGIKWRGPTKPRGGGNGKPKSAGFRKTVNLGGNIKGWVRKSDLTTEVRISRFLKWHEQGTTGTRAVSARLGFTSIFNRESIAEIPRLENAMDRATDALDKRANKKIARLSISAIGAFRF